MGYKDMRGAIEETIGEKKSQETDEEILQIYHQCEYYISLIFLVKFVKLAVSGKTVMMMILGKGS